MFLVNYNANYWTRLNNQLKSYEYGTDPYMATWHKMLSLGPMNDALIAEYKALNNGADVPRSGFDLNAYRAYLTSRGLCDPLNGVPC